MPRDIFSELGFDPSQTTNISTPPDTQPRDIFADLNVTLEQQDKLEKDNPWYDDVAGWLEENLDVPAGIAAGIAGGMAGGSLGGPVGVVLGGIAGGALGTFAGSVASDVLTQQEVDYMDALDKTAMSIGVDLATLGVGKVFKPAYLLAKSKLGFSPEEIIQEMVDITGKAAAGTPESLMATQRLLETGGATLTPYQTGMATSLQETYQRLAEIGMGSREIMSKNVDKVNTVVQNEFQSLIAKSTAGVLDSSSLGQGLSEVLTAGKSALSKQYANALDEVSTLVGKKQVSSAPLKQAFTRFIESNDRKFFNNLDDSTKKYVEELLAQLDTVDKIPVTSLIEFEKKIASQVRQFGDINSGLYNEVAERQLGEFSSIYKDTVSNMIKSQDEAAAEIYRGAKTAYARGMQELLPDINKNVIKQANKENFTALGNVVLSNKNTDKISKLLSSVDAAYVLAKKEGKSMPFESAKEAKRALRSSYLMKEFPDVAEGSFNFEKYSKLAAKLSDPTEAKRMKIIMGEDFPAYRQLLNVMEEASKKPETELGTLLLRSKEYAAGAQVATATLGGFPMALAVFGAPIVMAKMSTNPQAVRRLLAMSNMKYASKEKTNKHLQLIFSDVVNTMTEDEKNELKEYLKPNQ